MEGIENTCRWNLCTIYDYSIINVTILMKLCLTCRFNLLNIKYIENCVPTKP